MGLRMSRVRAAEKLDSDSGSDKSDGSGSGRATTSMSMSMDDDSEMEMEMERSATVGMTTRSGRRMGLVPGRGKGRGSSRSKIQGKQKGSEANVTIDDAKSPITPPYSYTHQPNSVQPSTDADDASRSEVARASMHSGDGSAQGKGPTQCQPSVSDSGSAGQEHVREVQSQQMDLSQDGDERNADDGDDEEKSPNPFVVRSTRRSSTSSSSSSSLSSSSFFGHASLSFSTSPALVRCDLCLRHVLRSELAAHSDACFMRMQKQYRTFTAGESQYESERGGGGGTECERERMERGEEDEDAEDCNEMRDDGNDADDGEHEMKQQRQRQKQRMLLATSSHAGTVVNPIDVISDGENENDAEWQSRKHRRLQHQLKVAMDCGSGSSSSGNCSGNSATIPSHATQYCTDALLQFNQVFDKLKLIMDEAATAYDTERQSVCSFSSASASSSAAAALPSSSSSSLSVLTRSTESVADFLFIQLPSMLHDLHAAHAASIQTLTSHITRLRQQLNEQADEFSLVRLELEAAAERCDRHARTELNRLRAEELQERERERAALRDKQEEQEQQWLRERLKVEEEAQKQVAEMQKQTEEVNKKLAELSANTQQLLEGEETAIETGVGSVRCLSLKPSDCFRGQTAAEFHFRLAESQFLRMIGGNGVSAAYRVTEVEYIINPPLLKRYHEFKQALQSRGESVQERLVFHGTTGHAIDAIVKEGFKVGGVDVPSRHGSSYGVGIYVSESPAVAMGYIQDSTSSRLLFARLCPSSDMYRKAGPNSELQIIVCKSRDQILPTYVVHFTRR